MFKGPAENHVFRQQFGPISEQNLNEILLKQEVREALKHHQNCSGELILICFLVFSHQTNMFGSAGTGFIRFCLNVVSINLLVGFICDRESTGSSRYRQIYTDNKTLLHSFNMINVGIKTLFLLNRPTRGLSYIYITNYFIIFPSEASRMGQFLLRPDQ